jgi:hypothetical protein
METYVWQNVEETKELFNNSFIVTCDGCWVWKRSLNWNNNKLDNFYHRGKKRRVNIVAYELYNDVVLPSNYIGRPACNTPNCIHPHHTALYTRGARGQTPPLVLSALQKQVISE